MKMRMLAAAGVLVSAAVHLYLWFDVFRHAHVVGPAFMVNAVGGAVIAVLLVTWRHWIPLVLAVGFGVDRLGGLDGRCRRGRGDRCGRDAPAPGEPAALRPSAPARRPEPLTHRRP
jgi:hypothetical protein